MEMVVALPTVEIDGKTYYVDERLWELRNVRDLSDRREIPLELREFNIAAFMSRKGNI